MKRYRKGHKPDPKRFGSTFPLEATLSEKTIAAYKMQPALNRFCDGLLAQYPDVVGVELLRIEFVLLSEPKPKRR